MYGSTTKGDVVKRSDCILVYGSTTKGGVVKRSDCILLYGSTTNGGVVKRSRLYHCLHQCPSTFLVCRVCVGITKPPKESDPWFCPDCVKKTHKKKKSSGR